MILGLGIDIIEIERVRCILDRYGERFAGRILTAAERDFCGRPRADARRVAGRFAAKEAVLKALGSGLRGGRWRDVEILPDELGRPVVRLVGVHGRRAAEQGIRAIHVSISHARAYAVAQAVAEGPGA